MLKKITIIVISITLCILLRGISPAQESYTHEGKPKYFFLSARQMLFSPYKTEYEGDIGFSIEALTVKNKDFGTMINFDLAHMEIPEEDGDIWDDDINIDTFTVTVNALYLFGSGKSGIIRPYIGAGAGINYSIMGGDHNEDGKSDTFYGGSLQCLAGIRFFPLDGFSLDAEYRASLGTAAFYNSSGTYVGFGFGAAWHK